MKKKPPKGKTRYVEVTDPVEIAAMSPRNLTSSRWDTIDGKVWAHAGDLKRWREKRAAAWEAK